MVKSNKTGRLILIIGIAVAIAAFFYFDLRQFLSFEYLKSQQQKLSDFYAQNPWLTIAVYFVVYVLATSLSLPGAAILTLAGGAIFGLVTGTMIVSFASTLGATGAFLGARYVLQDWVQSKFGPRLQTINDGVAKEGKLYLFALRLVPAFPFFVVNLLMGLTKMKTWEFAWVSQLGMLAGTIVYVNAGTQLAKVDSPKDILSFKIILAFVLLGLFPIVAKKVMSRFTRGDPSHQERSSQIALDDR